MGFIFREKPSYPNIRPELIAAHGLTRAQIQQLKRNNPVRLSSGEILEPEEALFQKRPPSSYAYLSDTLYTPAVVPYLQGVSLLYHEATYLNELHDLAQTTGHSTAQEAALIAREAQVDRLIIGHHSRRYFDLNPLLEEARAVFPSTELATELRYFEV